MDTRTIVLIVAVVCVLTVLAVVLKTYHVRNNCFHDCWKDNVRILDRDQELLVPVASADILRPQERSAAMPKTK